MQTEMIEIYDLRHPLPISQDIRTNCIICIYIYIIYTSTTFSSSIRKAKGWLTMELTQPSWHRTKRVPISKVFCYFWLRLLHLW